MDCAITVDRLIKLYKATTAVDGISFALAPGCVTGLLGGNGAGKTTTIAMIMGLVDADLRHASRVLGADMPRERYRVLHRMNFESPYVDMPMRLTVRQNLTVFGMLYGVRGRRRRASRELAAELDLTDFLDRPTGKLSAGQKTRVVARQGADQPAGGAAARRADRLARSRHRRLGARRGSSAIARERGATILLASHNMSEVERLCERVIIMKQRPHRGRRHAGAAARALRPRQPGRGVPRRRARRGERARRRNERRDRRLCTFSPRRVGAMVLRYWYLLRSSWPRMLDLIYWPAVQMLMWGFLQIYVSQNAGFFAQAGGVFIGAVLLWDILFRGQLGFSISFLEEMYARNLGNLMMSPLRPVEFVAALMIMSIVRLAIGMVPVSLLAICVLRLQSVGARASRSRRSSSI